MIDTKRPAYYIYPGTISVSLTLLTKEQKLKRILEVVKEECEIKYNFSLDDLDKVTRLRRYATTRMIFYYYAHKHCPDITLMKIGNVFSQTHGSVLRGCKVIQQFIEIKQADIYDLILSIEKRLK